MTCAAMVAAQPYGDLLRLHMQAEPTEKFDTFCTEWQNAKWTYNVSDTINTGTLKTCDGLYTKSSALTTPVLVHARPATGPNRPPGLFPNIAAAASGGTQETVISVCSQVAASVTSGAPDKGQCPETHPFPSGEKLCCATLAEIREGNLARCVQCVGQACTEPRHCASGIVDGDLTISTKIEQWFPVQFSDIVLAAQVYNPAAQFSAANTKVALVPNINLGTGTRAFYASMSDPDRLKRLCFSETPTFGASIQAGLPPPWTLALTFLGNLVPGQETQRAVGPNVIMVYDGIDITEPDGHAVITSPAVAFSWILGASADLRQNDDIACDALAGGGVDVKNQQSLDADAARVDADTLHTWKMFTDTSVRVGLPFASNSACFDVDDKIGIPSMSDMQMLCDASAPDCVAVAARPGKACLIVARQTADGISLPYFHDASIENPPEAVFTTYAAREPISQDLAQMVGVAPLGSESADVHPKHSVDSCRSMCWQDNNCTAWTLDGSDCRIMNALQSEPVVTTDGLNLTCMEQLGFDVGPQSATCSDLPLDFAFSKKHQKCVHLHDYLQQPWCPEPWTTASNTETVPQLSHTGAAFVSWPRTTCVCGTNEHVVGSSSPNGRTGVRCTGSGAAVRHPGTYSQANYRAFRVFLRTDVNVLETFKCAVDEMCPDEAVARCAMMSECAGAIVDGATHTVQMVAGKIDTETSLVSTVGKTRQQIALDSAKLSSLPRHQDAPDQIFMQLSPSNPVQEGASCDVHWMHFVEPPLVCDLSNTWVKQSVDNTDNVRHGAVVCGDDNLAKNADRSRHECVDRPLVRTTPTLSDSLLAKNVNPVFTGAVPKAHGSDAAALYVGRVEQCVNPEYTLNVGPVVQPEACTSTVTVTNSGSEQWRTLQAEHPTMVREILQLSGCVETDSTIPTSVGTSMADLFQYANNACTRSKSMHAESTLLEFLQDGGDLLRDVYQASGCTSNATDTVYSIATECFGLQCDVERQVCPKGTPGSKSTTWCCTGGTWVEGDCTAPIVLPATDCFGSECTIEGQICPLGAPGASSNSFCCTNGKWQPGACPAKVVDSQPVKPVFDLDAKMTQYFENAARFCTDSVLRKKCCGSDDCVPKRCKTLKGVRPLRRCSVTAESCTLMTEWRKVVALGAIDTARDDNNDCSNVNIGTGAASLLSPPGNASLPSDAVSDYAVPYPGVLPRQLVAVSPSAYECVPSSADAGQTTFDNDFVPGDIDSTQVGIDILRSAWFAVGCFNTDAIPVAQAGVSFAALLGTMRSTCLDAQLGNADAEVRCCGRAGCNSVLACPTIEPLPLPLPVCPNGNIAHRLSSGYGCRMQPVVSGVRCTHLCAVNTDDDACTDKVAVDIQDVGCMLVPKSSCTHVKKWDDYEVFPCAAGLDVNGRACVGQANNDTKTCLVYTEPTQATGTTGDAKTISSLCPKHTPNSLHTPWAYHQQPGQCASSVFSANGLIESVQPSWTLCEQQAANANAQEFSYDDVTGVCVVNTEDQPCVTLSDVVNAVQEKNHYGSTRPESSGTDLRAWVGLDGELGAKAVFAQDATSPQVDAFVCMPKIKCGMRDAHGRCISTTDNILNTCDLAPQLALGYGCVTGCKSPSEVARFVKDSINECDCNGKNEPCMYSLDGKMYNNKFNTAPAEPFLDDTRTRCALHADASSCDADEECVSRAAEDNRSATQPDMQGLRSSDNCDYNNEEPNVATECFGLACNNEGQICPKGAPGSIGKKWCCTNGSWKEGPCPDATASCETVKGNGQPNPQYAVPELQNTQVDFHDNYAESQESLLGQDYASTFYRSWLALPWNRDRFIGAAARKSEDEDDERPFYASAIWSGTGGRDWDNLMSYDKRWMPGAAVVAMDGDAYHDGLDDLTKTNVPNPEVSVFSWKYQGNPPPGQFAAYSDRNHATPMWSPLRYWLLGAFDPFLDKDGPEVVNVKPRVNKIRNSFLPRIVAFRGRQPRQDQGAEWLDDVLVDRDDAANQCLQSCDDDAECKAVSLRNGLLVSDHEPLNFVNTGGGLGAQGSEFYRPQTCPNLFQPHVSAFQYNVVRWCPFIANTAISELFSWGAYQYVKDLFKNVFQSVFSGGLADSPVSGTAMSAQSIGERFSNVNFINPFSFKKGSSDHPDPNSVDDILPSYGQDWVHGMSASIGTKCEELTTGPSSLRGRSTTLGDAQCHIRLGLNHCNKCWKSQPNNGKLGTASSTETLQAKTVPKITCRRWKLAPLTSLGADTNVAKAPGDVPVDLDNFITAHDGDVGADFKSNNAPSSCPPGYDGPVNAYSQTKMCCKGTFLSKDGTKCKPNGQAEVISNTDADVTRALQSGVLVSLGTRGQFTSINLQNHNSDVPSDPVKLAKARLQRPTPVRFRYTTIYLPKTPIDVAATKQETTSTRYTRRAQAPVHSVHQSVSGATETTKKSVVDGDNTANALITNVAQAVKDIFESLGVQPDTDNSFWVQRSTACNNRQHQRPVFTSVRCPENLPMTCALPWPVYAQNIADNTANANNPTDYRIDGTKCVPMVAVCLQASWRYAGIAGESLCSTAGRLLELMLDKETQTSPSSSFDLGVPPHIDVGNFTWPVAWLQVDADAAASTAPFRTRRPEPPAGTVFAACAKRKPCNQAPCPSGMGLAWTKAGIPFCTRVGSGSRGFQQATRDVPKSMHSATKAFGGFVKKISAVSGTGPALYLNAANCSNNGCGGTITSHCDFSHVQDRAFPSCQTPERIAEACCSSEAELVQARMTTAEANLLQAPKTLRHAVEPEITCEAQLGVACGNADYAVRSVHDTSCSCNTAACVAGVLPNITTASLTALDTASVVVAQGKRCGRRVLWAPQYFAMGPGVTRCNGIDDITKGGGSITADGGQMCGCARTEITSISSSSSSNDGAPDWPQICHAPGGCAVKGVFKQNVGAFASCDNDVTLETGTADVVGSSADNRCAHECMYHGPTCWGYDVKNNGACVLHLDRDGCNQVPQYVRQRPVYKTYGTPSDPASASTITSPAPSPTAETCADMCTARSQCQAWAYNTNTNTCHLVRTVRKYVFTNTNLTVGAITDPNVERQVQFNKDYVAFLQQNGVNTSQPIDGSLAAELIEDLRFESNSSLVLNATDETVVGNTTGVVPVNATRLVTPCTNILGVLRDNSMIRCAQACDFGELSHGCTGFTIDTDCPLCSQGGGTFQAESSNSNNKLQFFTIDTGEKHATYTELQSCTTSCSNIPSCGYCVQVRSFAKQDKPKYVQIGTNRDVANMPIDHQYPWVTDGSTKWDAECCTQAPCGQSHGPSSFAMGLCPAPADDAELAGVHAISVLDTTSMRCVTQCEPRFANPPACDTCAQQNFDPTTNCTQCLPIFALASDNACSLCKDPKADITTGCQECLPGFRVSEGGACLEWTCTAELQFAQQFPSVTETTDVVLEIATGKRMATGAFVGTPELQVPASMRSGIVRHAGNMYLLGRNARFIVETGSVSNDAVLDVGDDSDWLDSLPIDLNVAQPLTRSDLMDPDGVLGHFRCGASGFNMAETKIDACISLNTAQFCSTNTVSAESKTKCAQACVIDENCVTYVHQAEVDRVFAPSVTTTSKIEASCQLYDSTEAAVANRPRNMMVNSANCAGAGVRVPTDGLVSYARPENMTVAAALDASMQFRVVQAIDAAQNKAGCWILSRWHRHRIIEEASVEAEAAQLPCVHGQDVATIAWLEQHAPLQGNDVPSTQLAGFMPRAITNYNLIGGTTLADQVNASSACVLRCLENRTSFATRWEGATRQCTCFDKEDDAVRVQTSVGANTNVVLTGRRPMGAPVDGRGPVPSNCVTQLVTGTFATTQACNDATETLFDGFVLDVDSSNPTTLLPRCRGLICSGETSISTSGDSNQIVRVYKHNVTKPEAHQALAFGASDVDPPLNKTTQLNAAACCRQCGDELFGANSYQFKQATGECTCYDARAKTCAPELRLSADKGACRYCTKVGEDNAVCRLVPEDKCIGVLQAQNADLCNNAQSVVTFSGPGVSQQCNTLQAQNTAVQSTVGCDRTAGCTLSRRASNFSSYFCKPVDRVNTNTGEWHKPPRAVDVENADTLLDADSMCRVVGYVGGRCTSSQLSASSDRVATCDCALDKAGNAVSACPNTNCTPGVAITKVWCCEDNGAKQPSCGASATASAVVADITTVFEPHKSTGIVASIGHSNVCSASSDFAQRFTLVRCAPQQCKTMGALVQNALFVASSQDNVLRRVPNDACETCGLCRHPVVYRTALFIERSVLATGASQVFNSSACPAHMPNRIASTQGCALTTWGGGPTCCPPGVVCTGRASTAPTCDVRPILSCADLGQACKYTRHTGFECKATASVTLSNVQSEDLCRQQCDIQSTPPCLLYEYVLESKLCLLGKSDSPGMRDCADPEKGATHREINQFAVVAVKKQPRSKVCQSATLRHHAQANHLAGSTDIVLSSVAQEHSALYSLSAIDKITRLYGSFARQYRSFVLTFEKPYNVLCGIGDGVNARTNCPGTLASVLGHAFAHPVQGADENAVEQLVFDASVSPLAMNDNVALVVSAAVLTSARQAGSDACIEQAELSVQASAQENLVSERYVNRVGLGWQPGNNAVELSANRTQRSCLQACLGHLPACNAFQHGSNNPLDLAECVLYVGQLPVPLAPETRSDHTVYFMNTQQSCTSPEQCINIANFETETALLQQQQTFQQALQRCLQETTASNGQPKLMGRASYVNIIRCPREAPRPTPWHVQFFDHDPGVLCWTDLTSAPGVAQDGHTTYPFTNQKPSEPEDAPDVVITDPVLNFEPSVTLTSDVTELVQDINNCEFVRNKNSSAVIQSNTENQRGFLDLRNVTKCEQQDANKDCGPDAVCTRNSNTNPATCVYECNAENCAETLLCRGMVHNQIIEEKTCLFLPIGTGTGHMQPPSALQPCGVINIDKMLVTPQNKFETLIKIDCCAKLG